MKKLLLILTCFSCLAGSVSLIWDANKEPDIAGYNIYSAEGTNSFEKVGTTTNTTVNVGNFTSGIHYAFYVTAFNTAGLESEPSNIIGFSVPSAPTNLQALIISASMTNVITLDFK